MSTWAGPKANEPIDHDALRAERKRRGTTSLYAKQPSK